MFYCERYHCTLAEEVCVQRQAAATDRHVRIGGADWFIGCVDCEQGTAIAKEVLSLGKDKGKDIVLCKQCGERPALIRKDGRLVNGLCGRCVAKGRGSSNVAKVTLDFARVDMEDLLGFIRAVSHVEFRTVEQQVMFVLFSWACEQGFQKEIGGK